MAAAGAYAARYWLTWDRFIGAHRDETLWLPLAMRANDPSLFVTDPLVPSLARLFPRAWVVLAAAGLTLTGDPGRFTLLASTILLVVYTAGVCALSLVVSGNRMVAVVVGLASLRVNVDLSGIGWGILVGNAEPRAIVYAAAPWIIAAFLAAPRTPWSLGLLGGAVGLLGNLHPASALHLGVLLACVVLLATPSVAGLRRALALVGGFALGIGPYAGQWLGAFVPEPTSVREIIAFRSGPEIAPAWHDVRQRLVGTFLVPLVLGALALRVAPADTARGAGRTDLVRLAVVAVAGTLTAPIVPWAVPRLIALAPLRLSGYVLLVSLVLAGELMRRLLLVPRGGRLAAALLGTALVLTAGGGRAGELARTGRIAGAGATALWADVGRAPAGEPRDDFLELCRWARAHTAPPDLFLTPPGAWASFRLYAARPLFVAFKDGSVVTMLSPRLAKTWYRRLLEVDALYAAFEGDAVVRFARAHGIRYVVQARDRPAIDVPIAYENRAFRVYATGARG